MVPERDDWSQTTAARLAAEAADAIGLAVARSEIQLVRIGTNGIFFAEDVVIRVSPPDESRKLVDEQLLLARWLTEHSFPTSAPLCDHPVIVDGYMVTFWARIRGDGGQSASRKQFGQLVRRFHALTNEYTGPLPVWEPLGRLGKRLDIVETDEVFSAGDRSVLCQWRDVLTEAVEHVQWELPPGPLHGDVHTGNLIVDGSQQYLVDLDRIAWGPREWDLTQQVAALQRFDGEPPDLDQFFDGYGWDLRSWPGASDLVRLRLLFMTSWLLTVPRDPHVRREIVNRMHYWRDPCDQAPAWHPV